MYDLERELGTVIPTAEQAFAPVWTRDGRFLVFGSSDGRIRLVRSDGSTQVRTLLDTGRSRAFVTPWSFSRDGLLVYQSLEAGHNATPRLLTVAVDGFSGEPTAGEPRPIGEGLQGTQAAISFDGRWIAYNSMEPGRAGIYVRRTDGSGNWPVSNQGQHAVWQRNANQLLYRSDDAIMSVRYSVQGDEFVPERPQVWLPVRGLPENAPIFDVFPDGKRIITSTSAPTSGPTTPDTAHTVVVLENVFDELRRRVPVP